MQLYVFWVALWLGFWTLSTEAREQYPGQYDIVKPEIRAWFSSQHNKHGGWCCDDADGSEFLGDYTLNADGSVDLDHGGKHHHVEEKLVLDGSNPTGHAVVWTAPSGYIYCFAPGAGG